MTLLYAAAFAVLLAARMTPAFAACVNAQCTDTAAIERARATIQATCGCTRAGQTHGKYAKCVKSTLKLANLTALIPQKACRKLIMRCEDASICGKPNAAVCCIAKANGKVKSSIVGKPAKCKKGNACGASLGFFSKFDACAADGTCAGPPTTTTTTTSTTTTSVTTPTVPCPDGCVPERIVTQSYGHCSATTGTKCLGGHCSVTATKVCGSDGECPPGETCSAIDCPPGQTCVTDGRLAVSILPAFPFPLGVMTTVDTGPPLANCRHDAIVPAGGFSVPVFCIPSLQFSSQVIPRGCESGGAAGRGNVWDATPGARPDADVSRVGDTSDGTCNPAGQACNTNPGGAGANLDGNIDTTRGDGAPDAPGLHTQLDIPVRSVTWSNADFDGCPDPDGAFDGADALISQFDFILSPTSATASAAFTDMNGDGCSRAGSGPDRNQVCDSDSMLPCGAASDCPGGNCVPGTLLGTPAPGPCCVVGQETTVAAAGLAFTNGVPLFDIIFSNGIPSRIVSCEPAQPLGTCVPTTNSCQD
jgi:hypothetical protein